MRVPEERLGGSRGRRQSGGTDDRNSGESERDLAKHGLLLQMRLELGRGHVVAFAEDPNFRAYFDGLNGLFMNAVFLGPGY